MNHNDFMIGPEFYTGAGKWRCTDVGTRTIVAIRLDAADATWYAGPPYAVGGGAGALATLAEKLRPILATFEVRRSLVTRDEA